MRISWLEICELVIREFVNSKFVNYSNRNNLNKLLFGFLVINIVTLSPCYIVTTFHYHLYEKVC